jgi:hypothetical protein
VKRAISGLASAALRADAVGEGFYLVRIVQGWWKAGSGKPFLLVELEVLEPIPSAGRKIRTRIYATPASLWKLNWFLQDFAYDRRLLLAEELDERALQGLSGVIKVSHHNVSGRVLVNLDGFAPALNWRSQFSLAEAS